MTSTPAVVLSHTLLLSVHVHIVVDQLAARDTSEMKRELFFSVQEQVEEIHRKKEESDQQVVEQCTSLVQRERERERERLIHMHIAAYKLMYSYLLSHRISRHLLTFGAVATSILLSVGGHSTYK